jgi:hypothetical protein
MAKKTQAELIDWVIAKIDEVMPDDANGASEMIQESPVLFIEEELDASADFVVRNAPAEMLSPLTKLGEFHSTQSPGDSIVNRLVLDATSFIGFFVIPSDFRRFMSLKLDNWERPIYELMERKDPRYKIMHNRYRGASWRKPQGVLIPFTQYAADEVDDAWVNRGLAIQVFRGKTANDVVEYFEYIPVTTAENMPEEIQDAVAWVCASRALQILKRDNESKLAQERAEMQLMFKIGTYREGSK